MTQTTDHGWTVLGNGYKSAIDMGAPSSAEVFGPNHAANARLMAAAPDLLAALESVLRFCVTPSGFPDKGKGRTECQQIAFDLARTAIAKATGA
jgi:hypothetical protein